MFNKGQIIIFFKVVLMTCCNVIFIASAAGEKTSPNVIEVYGQASINTHFDLLKANITISKQGRSIEKLTNFVNDKTKYILSLAKQNKISAQDITISIIKINKIKEVNNDYIQGIEINNRGAKQGTFQKGKTQKGNHSKNNVGIYIDGQALTNTSTNENIIEQFMVVKTMNINLSYTKQYDSFLTHVIKAGSVGVYTYNASSKLESEYQQEALEQAIINAKNKIQHIVAQTGAIIGDIVYIKEIEVPHQTSKGQQSSRDCATGRYNRFDYSNADTVTDADAIPNAVGNIKVKFEAKVQIKYSTN